MLHKLQSIHPKQNQNKITHESNKLSMLQLEEKTTRSVAKNKNNFINVIGDKCSMSIR